MIWVITVAVCTWQETVVKKYSSCRPLNKFHWKFIHLKCSQWKVCIYLLLGVSGLAEQQLDDVKCISCLDARRGTFLEPDSNISEIHREVIACFGFQKKCNRNLSVYVNANFPKITNRSLRGYTVLPNLLAVTSPKMVMNLYSRSFYLVYCVVGQCNKIFDPK